MWSNEVPPFFISNSGFHIPLTFPSSARHSSPKLIASPRSMMESAAAMESKELEEEGEAMRRTFERIEFLVKQGFLSDVDAARKKQEVIDSFCLAPMVDCRRRVQEGQGEDIVVGLGLGEGSSADMASEESVSTPTSVVAASAIMPEARPSLGEGSSSLEGEQAGEGEQEQSKRPELAEVRDASWYRTSVPRLST